MPTQHSLNAIKLVKLGALIMAGLYAVAWIGSFWPFDDLISIFGLPIGADYPQFFLLGKLLSYPREILFSVESQRQLLAEHITHLNPALYYPGWYPPFLAVLFSPLSQLAYRDSFVLFTTVSIATGLIALCDLTSQLRTVDRRTAIILLFGVPAILDGISAGQLSLVSLSLALVGTRFLLTEHLVSAGLLFGLTLYKPNLLGLVIFAGCVRYPRMIIGVVLAALLILTLPSLVLPLSELQTYYGTLVGLARGNIGTMTVDYKVLGLKPLLAPVITTNLNSWIVSTGIVLACSWGLLCRTTLTDTKTFLGATFLLNALCNVYLPLYDVALLFIPYIFTLERVNSSRSIYAASAALFLAPHICQGIAVAGGPQLFPLVLVALTVGYLSIIGTATRSEAERSSDT